MDLPPFAVTWDYRCPFARNAHEHLLDALAAGAPWDVTFVPFSLNQAHVVEGGDPVWDQPDAASHLQAMEAALVVRDNYPDRFLAVHRALFRARHEEARDLRRADEVAAVLDAAGAPGAEIMAEVAGGGPRKTFRAEHERAVTDHGIWGVPTFVAGGRAVFVRLMTRPQGDGDLARTTIETVVRLIVDQPAINEFKETTINR